jgi:hypothetical protein
VGHKALLLAVVLGMPADLSCGTDTQSVGPNGPCQRNSDCENGLECNGGLCVSPDASASDVTSTPDAGPSDAKDTH